MNRDWFGVDSSHAAPRMSELIQAIRAFLTAENGERITFDGRFYSIDADVRAPVFGPLDVPILIGAFNKYMVRTVGRDADGILGHGIFTDRWWSEAVAPELAVATCSPVSGSVTRRSAAYGLSAHRSPTTCTGQVGPITTLP